LIKDKREKLLRRATLGILVVFLLCCAAGIINNKNKTKAVANRLLVQQKEAEELAQKQKEEEARLVAEKLKQEEEKKVAEEKRQQDEKKKKEDGEKIQQAILGKGTSKSLPILMYHSIEYEKDNTLRVPKEKFRSQMQYLKDNGFTPMSLDELYKAMVFNASMPEKPIVITFDDGYVDNYTNAYPVLKEFGFKATIFMISGELNNPIYLNEDQIKELDKNGIAIESHTVTHKRLNELSAEEQKSELKNSKATLEKVLNREVKYFAYPYGKFNETTEKLLQELGYSLSVATVEGSANKSNGIYKLNRIYVSSNYDMEAYKKLINKYTK
jgi:peptidoglycan/xylan/chitin deacetylase (PgdA/CDA1 family)/cell division protein FtsL